MWLYSWMFKVLKLYVMGLPLCERQCAFVFYETATKSQLTYGKNLDCAIRYTDDVGPNDNNTCISVYD